MKIPFEVSLLSTEKEEALDEDLFSFEYWVVTGKQWKDVITIEVDEEFFEDDDVIKDELLTYLRDNGYIGESFPSVEVRGKLENFKIYSLKGRPLYQVILK